MIPSRPAICSSLCALAALVACSNASAAKTYVLKNPKQHCKVHYVKKVETVKKHEHGRVVKVHEILCVYVAPKAPAADSPPASVDPAPVVATPPVTTPPVEPAPKAPESKKEPVKEEPTKPSGPVETSTTLNVSSPEDCNIVSYGSVSENFCYYTLSSTVKTTSGNLVSPEATYGFENPGNESEIGTVKYSHSFRIEVSLGRVEGKTINTTVSVPGVGVVEEASGEEPWSVAAVFQETSSYKGSYSETKTVNW